MKEEVELEQGLKWADVRRAFLSMGENLDKAWNKSKAQFGTINRKYKLLGFNKEKFELLIILILIVNIYSFIFPPIFFESFQCVRPCSRYWGYSF